MSRLVVGSEENEEESNQTFWGPETLGRQQQNGCIEKTKGRERFKQVTGCKLGCTYIPPQGSHLLVRSTTLKKKKKKRNTTLSQAVPMLVSHSLGPPGIQLFFFSLLSYPKTSSKHLAAPGSGPSSVSFCPQDNASCFNCSQGICY